MMTIVMADPNVTGTLSRSIWTTVEIGYNRLVPRLAFCSF